ncbi:MAG: hypothetical protein CMH50_06480 [Myxococcales bacterium]|nr:hypothetical protein [Myxococcales bacterium]
MKRYYEAHEDAYRRLSERGADCWGGDDFDHVYMLSFLIQALEHPAVIDRSLKQALVIGCGTGPLACALDQRGFEVSGVDISPTAIEMARQEAARRGRHIHYWVGDLCRDELGCEDYDLIVDSHCLHCIVPEADRQGALRSIHQALRPEGIFVLETMVGPLPNGPVSCDDEGIVWSRYGEIEPAFEPRVQRADGDWYVPQRRLRHDKAALDDELRAAGFQIHWSREMPSSDTNGARDYQGICGRR